jgi:hypothetical protein
VSDPVLALAVEPAEDRRRRRCIEVLELALAEAKDGRGFESVFIIGTYPDSTRIREYWTATRSGLDVVGRLEYLKAALLADMHGPGDAV